MYIFFSREELLGFIIKGLKNANMGNANTLAAVCEIDNLLQQQEHPERDAYIEIYKEWSDSINNKKNISEKIFDKLSNLLNKRK